mmetsp:Transcript_142340/g.442586  ORF Transcript_142340/g.442586 Transcript_142340/m.442586 type:complete len:236 (-) Transcript_142340:593-1300(-)
MTKTQSNTFHFQPRPTKNSRRYKDSFRMSSRLKQTAKPMFGISSQPGFGFCSLTAFMPISISMAIQIIFANMSKADTPSRVPFVHSTHEVGFFLFLFDFSKVSFNFAASLCTAFMSSRSLSMEVTEGLRVFSPGGPGGFFGFPSESTELSSVETLGRCNSELSNDPRRTDALTVLNDDSIWSSCLCILRIVESCSSCVGWSLSTNSSAISVSAPLLIVPSSCSCCCCGPGCSCCC